MSKLSWASQYSQHFKKLSDFQKYPQFHLGIDLFPKYYLVLELQLVSQNWNFFTKELFSRKKLILGNQSWIPNNLSITLSVYLESGTSTVANELTFKTTTSTGNRKWHVKIIQYECESTYKAPPDCLQYHTGVSGTFSSFNFGNIILTSTSYVICIRQERGFCNIGYATNEISGSEYTLSNTGMDISKVSWSFSLFLQTNMLMIPMFQRTDSCANAQIHIPLDPYSSIFCGRYFNQAQSNTAHGVVFCKLFTGLSQLFF